MNLCNDDHLSICCYRFCCCYYFLCTLFNAENLLKGSIATEVESRNSWSDRERDKDRTRDSVVQFPDGYGSEKDSDEDVSAEACCSFMCRRVHSTCVLCDSFELIVRNISCSCFLVDFFSQSEYCSYERLRNFKDYMIVDVDTLL